MEYRYMIWNDLKKEFQFPRICETTEKGANKCLFNCIGNDARKDRFQIKKVEKEEAKRIVKELKQRGSGACGQHRETNRTHVGKCRSPA